MLCRSPSHPSLQTSPVREINSQAKKGGGFMGANKRQKKPAGGSLREVSNEDHRGAENQRRKAEEGHGRTTNFIVIPGSRKEVNLGGKPKPGEKAGI